MYKVILIPIDRSVFFHASLAHAVSLARVFDARLILLHVVDIVGWANPDYSVNPLDWNIRKAETEAWLQARTAQLRQLGLEAEWHMLEGDAAEQTLGFMRTHAVDLVVFGARGQGSAKEWKLGSVANKIAHHARTSFLLVRASDTPTDQASEMDGVTYQRILLPLDGSQRAECALPAAAALARQNNGRIMLAHVALRPEMPRRTPLTQEEAGRANAVLESNRLEAERYLTELKERLPGEVENRVLTGTDRAFTLHQLASQAHSDVIVLSAHGCSNQAAWPCGGLTENFIAHAAAPVFVVQDTA